MALQADLRFSVQMNDFRTTFERLLNDFLQISDGFSNP